MNLQSGALKREKKQWVLAIIDFTQLVKLRLTLTVVFSALMAYWIALPIDRSLTYKLFSIFIGGFLITGAANALNQALEKGFDARMSRTANRPLPSGRMDESTAVLIAGVMSVFGLIILANLSLWSALLGAISLLLYAFVYTPLKRVSSVAVFVGAIPGALPVLIGTVSAQGELTTLGLCLFAIQFFWQFPHFWAISWLGHQDYIKAGFKITPSLGDVPTNTTGFQAFIYSLFLIPVCFLIWYFNISDNFSLFLLLIFSVVYI
ncbi:MAG: protoheme IX farnesyltransferase, partial [Bacteroidota bacterium]